MTLYHLLPAVLLVAACAVPNNPSQTAGTSGTEIQLADGQNCWNNQCFRFSKVNRSVSVIGKFPVRVPREIDVRDGFVTESEFRAMFQRASMAYSSGVGR